MDYENLLYLESTDEPIFSICFPAFIIGCLIIGFVTLFDNTSIVKKLNRYTITPAVVILGMLAVAVGGPVSLALWLGNSTNVERALAIDAASQTMVVTEKHELPRYTNYRLRCGKFDTIAARIPKYEDLSGKAVYAASFQDLRCWIEDEMLISKINDAINLYELYNNK